MNFDLPGDWIDRIHCVLVVGWCSVCWFECRCFILCWLILIFLFDVLMVDDLCAQDTDN